MFMSVIKFKHFLYLPIVLLLFSGANTVAKTKNIPKKVIQVRSDLWCPYTCEESSENPGIIIELSQKILEPEGYVLDYKLLNWSRAIEDTRMGKYDAIAGAAQSDAPDFIFPKEHQSLVKYSFFVLKDSPLVYQSHESFQEKGLGVIADYAYDEKTSSLMKEKKSWITQVTGDDGLNQLVKMLKARRIGAFIENPAVFYDFLNKNKLNKEDFKVIGSPNMVPQKVYIAFSPKFSDAKKVSEIITQGMNKLKKEGTLKKLIQKYQLDGI